MSEEPKKESRFWNFLVQSTHSIGHTAYVTGWFVIQRLAVEDVVRQTTGIQEVGSSLIYLTPEAEPVTLDVSPFLDGVSMSDVSPRIVVEALEHLFSSYEFKPTPPPAIDIPEGRYPPSVRAKMVNDAKNLGGSVIKGSMR